MKPIPAESIRNNLATWAVPTCALPAVAYRMRDLYPSEPYDDDFFGQYLQTTYFDTPKFALRKARQKGNRYLTLRLRCYTPAAGAGGQYPDATYALSAKTEDQKARFEIAPNLATLFLLNKPSLDLFGAILTPDLYARLLEISDTGNTDFPIVPVVTVCAHRYAVENDTDRLTLDVDTHTDTGKVLPYHVLEFKSTADVPPPPDFNVIPGLRPIHLSKFLWSTSEH